MKPEDFKYWVIKAMISSLFVFFSCELIVDEAFDCVVNRRPSLSMKFLEIGQVGEYYFDEVWGEVSNEPNDDWYDYYFDVYGVLPDGIAVVIKSRSVVFEGVPKESGKFEVTIELYVDGEYYDEENGYVTDDLCTNETSKSYTLRINPESDGN